MGGRGATYGVFVLFYTQTNTRDKLMPWDDNSEILEIVAKMTDVCDDLDH